LLFGRDKGTEIPDRPIPLFSEIRHVHMMPFLSNGIPENEMSYELWHTRYAEGNPDKVSNNILYYATYKDFILLLGCSTHDTLQDSELRVLMQTANSWVKTLMVRFS
jgi:metal-dependent hydrolase (beta-lactamase superfamily II)